MRLKLAVDLGNRDATTAKDSRLLNAYAESDGGRRKSDKTTATKRPGTVNRYTVAVGHSASPNDVKGQLLTTFTTAAGVATLVAVRGDTLNNAPTAV